jgi:hypothetical protein
VSKSEASVDLYWIPLGSGTNVVRISGALFEALSALATRRRRCDLYHAALILHVPEGHFIIEQAHVPDLHPEARFRIFRYEIRRWHGGQIPDVCYAVASPVRLSADLIQARRVLDLLPSIPTPVWGRDELHTGEMWNSNSVISWVLATGGIDLSSISPPSSGRAPGWNAGIVIAERGPLKAS